MSDMKVIMKQNIPEFMRVYPYLDGYLNAVGTSFETKKKYIDDFQFARDPIDATEFGVDKTLKSIGFDVPANTKPSISRTIMRDAMTMFARKGTTDSLVWALRIIGITPTIRQAWMPSPDSVIRGKIVDPLTGVESDYKLDQYSYNDFLYGEAVVTPEGNFFRGYKYNDPREENPIEGLPIKGEVYKTHPKNYTCNVSKLPYIAIRIDDENFNVVTGPYQDENGKFYEYGVSEEYQSAIDLIEYFLYDLVRPTQVRILLVASTQTLTDVIGINSSLNQKYKDAELIETDILEIEDVDGSQTPTPQIANFPIGLDPVIIGSPSPYYTPYMGLPIETVSDENRSYVLVHGEDMPEMTSSYPLMANVKVPIRGLVRLTVPTFPFEGWIYRIYTISSWDSLVPKLVKSGGPSLGVFDFELRPEDGVAFYITCSDGVNRHINIDITYTFEEN